ncbi:MAG: hypothetical protein Hyperionvirus21_12 [Hyperionvirus sp.]|uniref:AAA+ ATPase domain-containing protein n=1 Tax=Hyperionvirus sp. TaxID=2487770 RepID=A0A3G5AAL5_9VIRU|nr:MAG: hypothetical protein Hyperionvirus21_12 [Hyperionvirus sp.]
METGIWAIVMIPLLTAIFTTLVGIVWEFLVRMVLIHRVFGSDKMVRDMDKFLLEKGKECDVTDGSTKKPTDTWHLRRVGCGFIVAARSTVVDFRSSRERYSVYGTKSAIASLIKKIDNADGGVVSVDSGLTNQIEVSNFESSSPWKTSFTSGKESLPGRVPYIGQRSCVDKIVAQYQARVVAADSRKCFSALICGPPGTGKTNTALYLAQRLGGRVVFGFDLVAPGVSLDDLWRMGATKESPVILNLDEIDGAIIQAEKNETAKEFRCLAQNKTSLNGLLDRFGRTPYLIVLGTSNISFEVLWGKYQSYIRKGRFDLCFTLTRSGCKTERNE